MKITKLQIENLYGIEQLELDGKSIELTGTNGAGKSSVLDAIRLALTNNSRRKYIVKNGETEGRVLVKLDDGTTIDRKKRTDKSDYKSIKDEKGNDINSPENFLKEIFTPLQLEPVEFVIDKLWDFETGEEIETVNPGVKEQKVKIKLPIEVKTGYIIRRVK